MYPLSHLSANKNTSLSRFDLCVCIFLIECYFSVEVVKWNGMKQRKQWKKNQKTTRNMHEAMSCFVNEGGDWYCASKEFEDGKVKVQYDGDEEEKAFNMTPCQRLWSLCTYFLFSLILWSENDWYSVCWKAASATNCNSVSVLCGIWLWSCCAIEQKANKSCLIFVERINTLCVLCYFGCVLCFVCIVYCVVCSNRN